MKVLLTICYDGTNYCGWQRQSNGETTIQQVIENGLFKLYGTNISILGASRTDSGVHAQGQRATFTMPDNRIPLQRLHMAVNSTLPKDIRVIECFEIHDNFNVISDAKSKTYSYKIENAAVYNPLIRRYANWVKEPLNYAKMKSAALSFLGTQDFKAFCSAHSGARSTIRTIYSFDVVKENDIITLLICGNGFLYNMVRIIAGTLIEVGIGKIDGDEISGIIKSQRRENAGKTASAKGLTLIKVSYDTL